MRARAPRTVCRLKFLGNKKAPKGFFRYTVLETNALRGFRCGRRYCCAHAFDGADEVAFHARGEVLVNNAFVGNAVNHRLRFLHLLHSCARVASDDGFLHFFHGGAQLGAQGGVVGALLVVLTGALFSLG